MARYNKSLAKEAVGEYCAVAAKHGLTPVQLALAWCDSRWFVASTIIGATSLPQLRENIEAFSTQLSEECLADIDAVYRRYRGECVGESVKGRAAAGVGAPGG